MKFTEYIGSQFGNPRGMIGKICCIAMNLFNKKLYCRVYDTVIRHKGKKVLDIGVGNGYLEKMLSRKSKAVITGIDISRDMIKIAAQRNHVAVQQGRVILSQGDCCDLQFPNGSFDAVTSVNTIYFWSDTVKGLSEIRRVLSDNGIF
jgi:ubiquinone/menaquinone biosynthesis C-methylase UbiE